MTNFYNLHLGEEILKMEKELYFEQNKEVSGLLEFTNSYIKDILEGDKKEKINKQDFYLMEGYLDSLKEYNKILEEEGINNISIEIVEMFILGQNPEEFREFIKNNDFQNLINFGKLENIKLFFGKDFYNIKTKEELEGLINNNHNWKYIIHLIIWGRPENIKLFFGEDGIIKNKKELEKLMENLNWYDIIDLIEYSKLENIKLFFGEDGIINGIIKNTEELEKLINNPNWDNIIYLIKFGKLENIKLFFGEDGIIKNKEDLEELMRNPNWKDIIHLIRYGKPENIKLFFGKDGIIKNTENLKDLEELMRNPNWEDIKDLNIYGKPENIKLFFGKDGMIKTKEELEELINKNPKWEDIKYLIKNGKPENIKLFFGKDGMIKTKEELEELINNNPKWEHIKKAIIENGKKEIEEIFYLKKDKKNTFELKYENLYKNIGDCSNNEIYNLQILKNREYNNSIIIKIGDKVIGIIKKIGTNSFLSFEDVFDEKGYLIFAKGWIYNLVLNYDIGNNKSIDLLEEESVKRNPLRKIIEKNNPDLYSNFDKLVEDFVKNIEKEI